MGVPTSEVGYTSAMPRREDHEVHKDMWGQWGKTYRPTTIEGTYCCVSMATMVTRTCHSVTFYAQCPHSGTYFMCMLDRPIQILILSWYKHWNVILRPSPVAVRTKAWDWRRLLGLRVWIMMGTWLSVFLCCVLSGRSLCVELITRPEKSYRLLCVWVWSWSLDNEEALAR